MELLQHKLKYHRMHSTLAYEIKSITNKEKFLYNVAFTLMNEKH